MFVCFQQKWFNSRHVYHLSVSYFCAIGRPVTDLLINNICEVFNGKIAPARDKPVITLLEYIREYCMKRIVVVQGIIDKTDGPLTPTAAKILEKIKSEAESLRVIWNGGVKYQVTGAWGDQCVVNVQDKVCTCRKWELTGIPCKHAVAACWNMGLNGIQVGPPESWVHSCYWLSTWKEVYSHLVEPIRGSNYWEKTTHATELLPPKHHVQVGRPKKKRRRSKYEDAPCVDSGKLTKRGRVITCRLCGNAGHNKTTCKGQGQPPRKGNY